MKDPNSKVIVIGNKMAPMNFTEDQFYFAKSKVVVYTLAEARNLMRRSRYFRKNKMLVKTHYAVMRLVNG